MKMTIGLLLMSWPVVFLCYDMCKQSGYEDGVRITFWTIAMLTSAIFGYCLLH